MTTSEQPDNAQQLREEIERTREHLGETVEQLAGKVDVKGRAQARAAELAGQVTRQVRNAVAQAREQAAQVRKQAAARAGSARGTLAATTADARRTAVSTGQATPDPVQQAAAKGADAARKYRVPLSAAAAGLLTAIAIIILRRSKR